MTLPFDRANRVRAGDRRALASLMRDIDDGRPGVDDELRALRATMATGAGAGVGADIVITGITGTPGAGKSTLVDALIANWRGRGRRVGVVSIDPSSPVAGGAVLGDRVRMQRHATDDGVFIRSVAARGATGGLSRSTLDLVAVLAAAGFSRVLVETVGVGQAEVDIAGAADVTVVVTVPGLGDEVQTMKAGILEIADIFVVNKADRPGADQTAHDLRSMLALRQLSAAVASPQLDSANGVAPPPARGEVPIIETVASSGRGVPALVDAIEQLGSAGAAGTPARRRRRAAARIRCIVIARAEDAVRAALREGGLASDLADDVAQARLDPDEAADALMTRLRGGY
ncbi:MAG: methylmalonyl Co-A mutase-associated GTPase MeaB [Pseudomonadota bacterium]